MRTTIKSLLVFLALIPMFAVGQIHNPVSWTHEVTKQTDSKITVQFHATIENHWHLYSPELADGGPIPTALYMEPNTSASLNGALKSSKKPIVTYDSLFMMEILYFDQEVTFTQKYERTSADALTLTGYIEYMTCDDTRCLPPNTYEFQIDIPAVATKATATVPEKVQKAGENTAADKPTVAVVPESVAEQPSALDSSVTAEPIEKQTSVSSEVSAEKEPEKKSNAAKKSILLIFIGGFLGGLIALLTPCVFPMIPMTVSVFMKMGGKGSGIKNAILYGLAIIVLYVSLGMIVTVAFGADALNALSTHPVFNIIFFLLLAVFASAFFGAFELQLPTSWANFFDSKVDTSTGFVSILFMAFTLALVSFSCTGPIIGTLLVEAAVTGNTLAPIMGMLGFSLALALPFTIFAMFPSMLNTLPKSGGWLNSVKVVLGFLELALAFKFLSTADMTMHWGILPRELFLAIWIVIFTLLGFYLLGKLKFAHDSDVDSISVTRLFLAVVSFVFALWMLPGMWGAPLKAISAFPPPLASQDFVIGQNSGTHTSETKSKKYGDLFHCPNGMDCYFDMDEALAVSKAENKPLLIDFTGHGCVNCREMEANVLSDEGILKQLADDYVIVSLYVDDRTKLPESEQVEIEIGGVTKKIRTIGNKWSAYQTINYQTNSQPYYVVVNSAGEQLLPARAYDLDISAYKQFLEDGVKAYK